MGVNLAKCRQKYEALPPVIPVADDRAGLLPIGWGISRGGMEGMGRNHAVPPEEDADDDEGSLYVGAVCGEFVDFKHEPYVCLSAVECKRCIKHLKKLGILL